MNDEVAIRLYQHPERDAEVHAGPYQPVDVTGWNYAIGDTIGLRDDFGGYSRGTIEKFHDETYTDETNEPYRVAVLILED